MFDNFQLTSALIGALAAIALVLVIMEPWSHRGSAESDDHGGPVDPWALQADLMRASGQDMPPLPELNRGSLMYAALILEECGETLDGIVAALRDLPAAHEHSQVQDVRRILSDVSHTMQHRALAVRALLEDCPEFRLALGPAHALEIFDGHEDLTVVNCGFGLSCGLPCVPGYAEVGASNLSKVNPDTGVIDKTPDGKWIKGRNYRKPDLARVLREYSFGYDDQPSAEIIPIKGAA